MVGAAITAIAKAAHVERVAHRNALLMERIVGRNCRDGIRPRLSPAVYWGNEALLSHTSSGPSQRTLLFPSTSHNVEKRSMEHRSLREERRASGNDRIEPVS
jgi:hypothetical protein